MTDPIIRTLTAEEMKDSHELIQYAFKQPLDASKPLILCEPEDVLGCFVDGELASNIIIRPMTTWIQGEIHSMGLVCGVASWPEYRKHGTVAHLMHEGLAMMRALGQTVSYLGPFSVPFYRRYGWEMMYDYKRYKLQASAIPAWRGKGNTKRKRPDPALLNAVYASYAKRYNGMFVRDASRWDTSVFEKKNGLCAVYYNEEHEATGYLLYQFEGNELRVHEMVHLDRDSRHGLWEFIKKQDSMFDTVSLKAPSDDLLHLMIDNPKGLEIQQRPHFMVRIVDVIRFIENYRFKRHADCPNLYLHIADPNAPWNDGCFKLQLHLDGKASVKQVNSREAAASEGIACDIQTLSTMLIGYQTPLFLFEQGRINGESDVVHLWEYLIPKRITYSLDIGY